jgi:hypothetical protein
VPFAIEIAVGPQAPTFGYSPILLCGPLADTIPSTLAFLMIDFEHVWLPQILGYAKIIITGQLEDQWLGRIDAVTSVTDPDELYEQIFDDLDAENIWSEARQLGKLPQPAVDAMDRFLRALHDVDGRDGAAFVSSEAWTKVQEAAAVVLADVVEGSVATKADRL